MDSRIGDGDTTYLRREKLSLSLHLDKVVVPNHIPETRPVRLLVPINRILASKYPEHLVMLLGHEPVEVEKVHVTELHRCPRGLQRWA